MEDSSFRNRKAFLEIRRGSPGTRVLNERWVGKICDFQLIQRWLSETGDAVCRVRVKRYRYLAAGRLVPFDDWHRFSFTGHLNMHRCCTFPFALAALFLHVYVIICAVSQKLHHQLFARACQILTDFQNYFQINFLGTLLRELRNKVAIKDFPMPKVCCCTSA